MVVIGLTGGVGSGKTTAAKMLAEILDAKLLIADDLGHVVLARGQAGFFPTVQTFGTAILGEDGQIDRKRLSALAFSHPDELAKLNAIVHPAVRELIRQEIEENKDRDGFLVLETALMFETGCEKFCDEVWAVFVSEQIRKERLKKDRGYSEQKTEEIMQSQLLPEEFLRRCPVVIDNNAGLDKLNRELFRECVRLKERLG